MVDRDGFAELHLPKHGISLYGSIVGLSGDDVRVSLLTLPRDPALLLAGEEVELTFVRASDKAVSFARVTGIAQGDVQLRFITEIQPAPKRQQERIHCDMAVKYRAIRLDGRTGAWLDCSAEDISIGGIGLIFDRSAMVPRKLEILAYLPSVSAVKSGSRSYADDGSVTLNYSDDDQPIRAVGRIVHTRPYPQARTRAGMIFTVLAQAERQRIERLFESIVDKAA